MPPIVPRPERSQDTSQRGVIIWSSLPRCVVRSGVPYITPPPKGYRDTGLVGVSRQSQRAAGPSSRVRRFHVIQFAGTGRLPIRVV